MSQPTLNVPIRDAYLAVGVATTTTTVGTGRTKRTVRGGCAPRASSGASATADVLLLHPGATAFANVLTGLTRQCVMLPRRVPRTNSGATLRRIVYHWSGNVTARPTASMNQMKPIVSSSVSFENCSANFCSVNNYAIVLQRVGLE